MAPSLLPRRCAVASLLACAAAGAQAQADYSVYGVADFSYGRFEPSGTVHRHRFNSNSLTASFVGVEGRYGLEGGWTPGLTLETFVRFQDAQTGRSPRDPLLSRNAFVSLAQAEVGRVRIGRLQTFLFDATTRFNALGNSVAFSPAIRHLFAAGNLEGVQGDFYWDRAISYQTPNFENIAPALSGVSLNLMHGGGGREERGDYDGASLVVSRGLLSIGLAAQRVHVDNGFDDPTDESAVQLAATYNFGWGRVFAQVTTIRDRGLDVDSRIVSAGATLPLGPGNLSLQVATTTADGPAVDRRHTSFGTAYVYAWDSVTDVYAIVLDDRIRGQTRGLSYAGGVRWRF